MDEKNLVIYFSEQNKNGRREDSADTKKRSIPLTEGMSLYHVLQKEGISLSAPCAGNGTCGACKVKVIEGSLPITEKDRQMLSDEEITEGWRLACQAYPEDTCGIYVPREEFAAVTGYGITGVEINADRNKKVSGMEGADAQIVPLYDCSRSGRYSIAIDLGTTTLAYELFDTKTGNTVRTLSSTNPQRIYGADVVSRMEQSDNGRRDMLKLCIRQGMKKDITCLLQGIEPVNVQSIAISGNTAMVHLFMGYSCEGLGRYPFWPVTLESIQTSAAELNLMEQPVPVFITGGISAYVGGDILSGIAAQRILPVRTDIATQKLLTEEAPCLYIDLGTNAEMALFDGRGKIYVTSAPAGPAFEAANISCGVGSVEGAVSSISIQNGQQVLTTIGKKDPVGFCGSGILEAVYELLKNEIIDETGLLEDPYFEKGYPVGKLKITQQDIRQIQLAKSAVFSAVQILMKRAGISSSRIVKVYLAGGFGFHLNVEKAIGIGLLPEEFAGKVQTIGNSSLHGSKEVLQDRITEEELLEIKNACEEIYLSNENDFQDIFMENMNFNRKTEV